MRRSAAIAGALNDERVAGRENTQRVAATSAAGVPVRQGAGIAAALGIICAGDARIGGHADRGIEVASAVVGKRLVEVSSRGQRGVGVSGAG